MEFIRHGFDTLPGIGQRQARPTRKVGFRCRAMATKVPAHKLGQRLASRHGYSLRGAFFQQHVGKLLAASWAAADQPFQLGPHDDIGQTLAAPVDAACDGHAGSLKLGL